MSSSFSVEDGQVKLDFASLELGIRLCVVLGLDLVLTAGFDFASTHLHLYCLRSSFNKFLYLDLRVSDSKSTCQLVFF